MSNEDKKNEEYFPHWIFWNRLAERQDEDTSDENGVINGVQRMLAQQSVKLKQQFIELETSAQLKQEFSEHEARMQDMGAKMEKELSELESQMDKLQQTSEKVEKANESMQAEMSAKFDQLLVASFRARSDAFSRRCLRAALW